MSKFRHLTIALAGLDDAYDALEKAAKDGEDKEYEALRDEARALRKRIAEKASQALEMTE